MANLWIFGDSYGIGLRHDPIKKVSELTAEDMIKNQWVWPVALSKKLNCSKLYNYCMSGCSNDYIFYRLLENQSKIQKDDYVVIISTSIERKWFLEKFPEVANFYTNNILPLVKKEIFEAITQYLLHLDNPISKKLDFYRTLAAIHHLTDLHDWNLLIIPGFEEEGYPISHKYQVTGSLYDICFKEFHSQEDTDWFYNIFSKHCDKRFGHLSKFHHEILLKKLVDTFTNNAKLDLTSGFREKFISKQSIDEYEKTQLPILNEDLDHA